MRVWLWKNGAGAYYAVWKERGKTRRRSLGTTRKRVAEQRVRRFRPSRRYTGAARTTVAQAAARWADFKASGRRQLTRSTLNDYRRLAEILGPISDLPCSALSPVQVEGWCDHLEGEGLKPATIRRALTNLGAVVEWASTYHPSWGFHGNAPKAVLKTLPRPAVSRKPALAPETFWTMIAQLRRRGELWASDLADCLETQWFSGLRCTELARLTWDDVDLDAPSWTIRSPHNKGGARRLPMHARAAEIVAGRRHLRKPFPSEDTTFPRWLRFRREHGFEGADRGSIRHSFITRLREAGALVEAKELARHSTSTMTDHYTHPSWRNLCSALKILRPHTPSGRRQPL